MPDDLGIESDPMGQEQGTGDILVRQLRRRYDVLRDDYEALIDRLGELEERLASREASDGPAEPRTVIDGVVAPLLRLREEYVQAVAAIQRITQGLDTLAAGTMKGQRSSAEARSAPEPAARRPFPSTTAFPPSTVASQPPPGDPERLHVEVKGRGFGEMLDFQEELSRLPGVARVSINAIDNERASLIVELSSEGDERDD